VPGGYLIGRAVDHTGPGAWWEYVATVQTYREACRRAADLAQREGRRVWFQKHGDTCTPLSRHHAAAS
jgi:hypothetical protein